MSEVVTTVDSSVDITLPPVDLQDPEGIVEPSTDISLPEASFELESDRAMGISEAHLKSVLESLVFVADKPVTPATLAKTAQAPVQEVRRLLLTLIDEYKGRGVELFEVAGGYQFRSNIANAPFVRDFIGKKPVRLSRAQVETIAIVSYRQPITRPEVEDIRGVDCGAALKTLLERDLIKILGRKEEAGRPLLYGTTPKFLEMFSLKGLKDLPTLQEFSELNEESRALFEKNTGESLSDMHFAEAAIEEESSADSDDDNNDEAHLFEDADSVAHVDEQDESRASDNSDPLEGSPMVDDSDDNQNAPSESTEV